LGSEMTAGTLWRLSRRSFLLAVVAEVLTSRVPTEVPVAAGRVVTVASWKLTGTVTALVVEVRTGLAAARAVQAAEGPAHRVAATETTHPGSVQEVAAVKQAAVQDRQVSSYSGIRWSLQRRNLHFKQARRLT
jgi:uncharacterized protein (DUF736 family)